MPVKHRIKCFDTEIMVVEKAKAAYTVNIQSSVNPLGNGNTLESFPSMEEAISAAEYMFIMYAVAKEHGYYFKEKAFIKPKKEDISVTWLIEKRLSEEEWRNLLQA